MSEPPGSRTSPAGFWIRAVALGIDVLVWSAVRLSLDVVASRLWRQEMEGSPFFQAMLGLFTLLFSALYTAVLHALDGQTLGKLAVGARVVGVDGERLSFGAALLRWLALWCSFAPLGLGFVMAGLRRDKRALHDLIAGSRVERSPARRAGRSAPTGIDEAATAGLP
ncbi:MAG TPA: RDD family protein [Methylomirabilota bacterium]|nr:RDD family protein [Methylomirabilota bacterium]